MTQTRFTCTLTRADESALPVLRTSDDPSGLRRGYSPRGLSPSRYGRPRRHLSRPRGLARLQRPQPVGARGPGAGRRTGASSASPQARDITILLLRILMPIGGRRS